jgi:hypothetical protein
MNSIERASAVIAQTESALKELLGDAAQEGDYPAVLRIAAWARTIHDLTSDGLAENATTHAPLKSGNTRTVLAAEHPAQRRGSRKKEKHDPTFFRAGDEIVMQALSKRGMKEYQHKASHAVLQALAMAMEESGAGGRVFTTDEILPIRDLAGQSEVPNYKAYVGISFLKHTGAIDQHGRSGYSIPKIADFRSTVEQLWNHLPVLP